MNFALVCAILASISLSAPEAPAPPSPNINVERLFKLTGTLAGSEQPGNAGKLTLHFAIYNAPFGGKASWQETQNVSLDDQGHYTTLLGDTNPGGLPASVFSTDQAQWLDVQSPGKQSLPRMLLVESSSPLKADSISPNQATMPQNPVERRVGLLVLIMFVVGVAMAIGEVRKWWKTRVERYGEPQFVNSLRSTIESDTLKHAAQLLRGIVSNRFQSIRGRFRSVIQKNIATSRQVTEHSMPNIEHNTEKDQTKAA